MKIFLLIVTFAFSLLAQADPADDYTSKTLVKVGDDAPKFTADMISGDKFSLSEQKEKVVLISFFATWCPHCLAELPKIEEKIYNVFKDHKDFELIIIGRKHSIQELKKFKETKKFVLPFAADPTGEIYGKYAAKYIPRNFVIGKDGKIKTISKESVGLTVEEILSAVKKEIEKK